MKQKQSESMKGKLCPFKPILCQEGWCNDCQIYLDYKGHQRTMGRDSVVVGRKDFDDEVCLRCGASRTALREMIAEGGKGNLTIVNHILENCPSCKRAIGVDNNE